MIQSVDKEARQAGADLIKCVIQDRKLRTFDYVNNRLEWNALQTIEAMIRRKVCYRGRATQATNRMRGGEGGLLSQTENPYMAYTEGIKFWDSGQRGPRKTERHCGANDCSLRSLHAI